MSTVAKTNTITQFGRWISLTLDRGKPDNMSASEPMTPMVTKLTNVNTHTIVETPGQVLSKDKLEVPIPIVCLATLPSFV